jgi:hypothetical protein
MAQRIQTVCDVHLAQGLDTEGETWEVLVRKAGSRAQMREVDLCGECSASLEAVAAFAAEHGRTQAGPRARTAAAALTVTPTGKVACTVEGCTSMVSAGNLPRHLRDVHGQRQAAPDVYPCPDCAQMFARPQGLGAHRYRAHGYESPTRAERAERAERKAS